MMRVVIYASNSVSAKIKTRLSNDIEVLSIDSAYMDNRAVDDSFFFLAENRAYVDKLVAQGIKRAQIIDYSRFRTTSLKNPIENIAPPTFSQPDLGNNILLMGMSHSQCAIDTKNLNRVVFKMSSPSMDMFCHLKYLEKFILCNPIYAKTISNVILELPYYIFNYDLSKFGDFVYTKYKYFEDVDDYHHVFEHCDVESRLEFLHFTQLIDKEEIIIGAGNSAFVSLLRIIRMVFRTVLNRDKVWTTLYEETIEENTKYWREIIKLVNEKMPAAKLSVLVMPFNPLFRWTHKTVVEKQKKYFYKIIGSINVVDEFDLYNDPLLYSDHCHLNSKGGHLYTRHFNQLILRQ